MEIFKISFDESYNIVVVLSPIILLITILLFAGWRLVLKSSRFTENLEIDEAEIGIGSGKIKVKPNYGDMQIAYQLYVELSTRKIGLKIDFDEDSLIEVYNSWYEFFKITRSHIKELPAHKIRENKTTKAIVKVAIEVLNEGLRPHLTKWQSRFRKWYEINSIEKDHVHKSPQELQKEFPEFNKMKEDMQKVNKQLIEYRKVMKRLSIGDK